MQVTAWAPGALEKCVFMSEEVGVKEVKQEWFESNSWLGMKVIDYLINVKLIDFID